MISIERVPELGEAAREAPRASSASATSRWWSATAAAATPRSAPYDAIAVHAATPEAPHSLLAQLATDGRLVVPIATGSADLLTAFIRENGDLRQETIGPCRFVPLIGAEGFNPPQAPGAQVGSPGEPALYVLNFYSPLFVDQLKRGRKTATIRLGDKSRKYKRGQVVWITIGFRHQPREKIFAAVIDDVEVKKVAGALAARHRARQPRVPPARGDRGLPGEDLHAARSARRTPSR